jgi:hypothetical protein
MEKVRFVGLDVHKESIAIAVADGDGSKPEDVRRLDILSSGITGLP